VLDLHRLDLDTIATALADQGDYYERQWLVDPARGELVLWTSDTGIDGQNQIELDELDDSLVAISPLQPSVWYRDMVDFAETVSDEAARTKLLQALEGRGAFRRFKNELYQRQPDLVSAWHAFRDRRGQRRAVEWLVDDGLVDGSAAEDFLSGRPEPRPT
jgi:hypothetical protein